MTVKADGIKEKTDMKQNNYTKYQYDAVKAAVCREMHKDGLIDDTVPINAMIWSITGTNPSYSAKEAMMTGTVECAGKHGERYEYEWIAFIASETGTINDVCTKISERRTKWFDGSTHRETVRRV